MAFANVVLADPDDNSRGDYANMIRVRHHTVHETKDGEEAHAQFRRLMAAGITPVLVVAGNLPKMNGLDLIANIRKEYGPNPPVIMITDTGLPAPPEELGIDELFSTNAHIGGLRNAIYDLDSERAYQRQRSKESPASEPSDFAL